jgi:choline-sulfatase
MRVAPRSAIACLLLFLTACSRPGSRGLPPAAGQAPNILLIVVDTLRPDALSWVAGHNATPEIDALANGGARFPAAVSPVPLTLPAHASLFTGLLPVHHGVRDNGHVLRPGVPTLGEVLRRHGYATGAFVSGYPLRAVFGLDRGFDHYDDALPVAAGAWRERPGRETTRAALDWLEARSGAGEKAPQPWFLFVHYYEPHDPYTPPPGRVRPGPRGLYDGEVAEADAAVGELLRGLSGLDAGRGRITLFTGDHGESLGEHGEATHGFFVYDATILVPLVVHYPGRVVPRRHEAAVRLVDVAATLLELAGVRDLAGSDGASFASLLDGGPAGERPALVESQQPFIGYGWSPLRAVREGGFKLIDAPRPELYELDRDPGERENRVRPLAAKADRLRLLMERLERASAPAPSAAADAESLERLRALGYVGGGGAPSRAGKGPGLADPKDRLQLKDRLAAANAALERGEAAAAVEAFRGVLAQEPDNRFALLRTGTALVRLGRVPEGIRHLERAVSLDATQAEALYSLAEALSLAGQDTRAAERWRALVRLQPRRAVAWSNLGAVLLRAGDDRGALEALERAVALAPQDETVLENLREVRRRRAADEGAARSAPRPAVR